MHLSTNFGKEIREKKSPGTNGLMPTLVLLPNTKLYFLILNCAYNNHNNPYMTLIPPKKFN